MGAGLRTLCHQAARIGLRRCQAEVLAEFFLCEAVGQLLKLDEIGSALLDGVQQPIPLPCECAPHNPRA